MPVSCPHDHRKEGQEARPTVTVVLTDEQRDLLVRLLEGERARLEVRRKHDTGHGREVEMAIRLVVDTTFELRRQS